VSCLSCKSALESNWLFCPHCGHKASLQRHATGEVRTGFSSGSYGMGVRSQILELAVRQAMVGGPWKEQCAHAMATNSISADEVETEVRRRQSFGSFYSSSMHPSAV
jgi:hypothetical protein